MKTWIKVMIILVVVGLIGAVGSAIAALGDVGFHQIEKNETVAVESGINRVSLDLVKANVTITGSSEPQGRMKIYQKYFWGNDERGYLDISQQDGTLSIKESRDTLSTRSISTS